ncbi:DUF6517 family protein [Natrinema thermotolerans]|uniref:DUF6517 family protein n=1 Tax=Natrinema thermotolerans TaxID=121872 RepID=A0AAF0T022_9EURY|nr:DUF6517 family protein [Natrinema thermotolerans]QCC57937.1 hypothetical protein DVR14_04495 [Natrinema thermotolerans]WMT09031.1 DUF6517 family protein [Natrinema thermotolerans]
MNRRTVIAGLGAAGLAGLSGCLGLLGMDEHESSPAGVTSEARAETGYEQTAIEPLGIERDVGPTNETVTVTNYMTKHEKRVGIQGLGERRAAVFNVLTTPQVSILGQELNPVEEMSTEELIDLVRSNYDGIDNVSHDEDATVTILGESTTKSRYSADAEFDGRDVAVDVHITEAVEADDDLLVTIGVYPEPLQGREAPNVATLTEAVTTDVDEGASSGGADSDSDAENGSTSDDNDSDDGILG